MKSSPYLLLLSCLFSFYSCSTEVERRGESYAQEREQEQQAKKKRADCMLKVQYLAIGSSATSCLFLTTKILINPIRKKVRGARAFHMDRLLAYEKDRRLFQGERNDPALLEVRLAVIDACQRAKKEASEELERQYKKENPLNQNPSKDQLAIYFEFVEKHNGYSRLENLTRSKKEQYMNKISVNAILLKQIKEEEERKRLYEELNRPLSISSSEPSHLD